MGELIATADGGYAFTGWALSGDGDLSGHHEPDYTSDVWVVKLDADGTLSWQKNLGGSGADQAECIIQTSDGGYAVAGHTQSSDGDVVGQHGNWDIWVVKLDPMGISPGRSALAAPVENLPMVSPRHLMAALSLPERRIPLTVMLAAIMVRWPAAIRTGTCGS